MPPKSVSQLPKDHLGRYQLSACAKARIAKTYFAKPYGDRTRYAEACGIPSVTIAYWHREARGTYWQDGDEYKNQPLRSFPEDAVETREASLRKTIAIPKYEAKVQLSDSIPPSDIVLTYQSFENGVPVQRPALRNPSAVQEPPIKGFSILDPWALLSVALAINVLQFLYIITRAVH